MKRLFLFLFCLAAVCSRAQFAEFLDGNTITYAGSKNDTVWNIEFQSMTGCTITITWPGGQKVINDKCTMRSDTIMLENGFPNCEGGISRTLLIYDHDFRNFTRYPGIFRNLFGRRLVDANTCYDFARRYREAAVKSHPNKEVTFIVNKEKLVRHVPLDSATEKPVVTLEYCTRNLGLPQELEWCASALKLPEGYARDTTGLAGAGSGFYSRYDEKGRLMLFGYSPVQVCNTCLDGFEINITYNAKTGLAETITSHGGALISTITCDERGSIIKILTMNYDEVREELDIAD